MPGSCQPTKGCELDATHVSPNGSRLWAASSAPAWPADASTVPSTRSHQACLVRPVSRQPGMCQTASLAQRQLFLPLRRIEAIEFLSTEPPPPQAGHQGTEEASRKSHPALQVSCHPGEGAQGRLGHPGSHRGTTWASSVQKGRV